MFHDARQSTTLRISVLFHPQTHTVVDLRSGIYLLLHGFFLFNLINVYLSLSQLYDFT